MWEQGHRGTGAQGHRGSGIDAGTGAGGRGIIRLKVRVSRVRAT